MKKFSMKKLARVIPIAAMCMLTLSAGSVSAKKDQVPLPTYQNSYNNYIQPIATAIDYYTGNIYLFNYENDKLVIIDPVTIIGWPQNGSTRIPLQHTIVSPDGSKVYITTDATDLYPAYIIALKINSVDWNAGSASLAVENMMTADAAGTPGEFPFVEPVNDVQNVPNWVIGRATQIHGPTILPFSDFVYFTEFTSNRVRVVNTKTDELVSGVDPIVIPGYTENTHGVNFNKSGTIGLGTGYFFDNSVIDVYKPDNGTGQLQPVGQIQLGNEKKHAAFSHFTAWIDERYAVTATMQLDKTSLTPSTTEQIIPPSVWLLDAIEGTATKILDRAANANAPGVFRSASDLTVVNGKLYIAEEDSIDFTFADDGYISIYDLTDRTKPKFIKRLKPGVDLPAGFAIAHTIAPTPDNRYLIVASWASGYVLKIDTLTDTVVKVWGPNDGLVKPHGIYTAGQIR